MSEKIVAALEKELLTTQPDELVRTQRVRLEALEARRSELNLGIDMLKWEIDQARSRDSDDASQAARRQCAAQPMYHEDAQWCRLDLEVLTREHVLAKGRSTCDIRRNCSMQSVVVSSGVTWNVSSRTRSAS